ncbi:MAG: DUF1501 domain-containing protein [Fuerstiella sp.]
MDQITAVRTVDHDVIDEYAAAADRVHTGRAIRGIVNQHQRIQQMDTAVSTLITDIEEKRLLDKALIVITTEFGRSPEFDSGGGCGHQGAARSCVMAGGGLSLCHARGGTDELSKEIVANPVGVPDFFATICAAVGIEYHKTLFSGDRPVPIIDRGSPIAESSI